MKWPVDANVSLKHTILDSALKMETVLFSETWHLPAIPHCQSPEKQYRCHRRENLKDHQASKVLKQKMAVQDFENFLGYT